MKYSLLLAAAGLMMVQTAGAATLGMKFISSYNTGTVQRDVGDGAGFITLNTGLLKFKVDPAGANYDYLTLCLEPRQFVNSNTQTYTIDPLEDGATNIGGMGTAKANLLRELFGRYYPVLNTPKTDLIGGALQIAVWEIVRENSGTLDLKKGNTKFRNESVAGMMAQAQTYLNSLDGTGPMSSNLVALNHPLYQDVAFLTPEPGTYALLGSALAALAVLRRRR